MRILTNYRKHGFQFAVVHRESNLAVFLGTKEGSSCQNYETIHIQSHNGRLIHGNEVEPAEYPPSDSQWGTKGWSFDSLDDALAKLKVEQTRPTSEQQQPTV